MPKNVKLGLISLLVIPITVVALVLSFPPVRLSVLIFLVFVPILYLSRYSWSPRQAFLVWWSIGMLFYLFHLHWLVNLYVDPWVKKFLWLGFIFLAIYQGLYYGIQGFIASKLSNFGLFTLFPLAWFFVEWLRGVGEVGFPWSPIYLPAVDLPLIKHTISVFGGLGLGIFIISVNVFLSQFSRKGFLYALFIILFILTTGLFIRVTSTLQPEKELRVALLQPNILEEGDEETEWEETYTAYMSLANKLKGLAKIDLIVLSESAIPGFYSYSDEQKKFIKTLLSSTNAEFVVFGTADIKNYKKEIRTVNSAYLMKDSLVLAKYDKVHLVPFGEWIPYENIFEFLRRLDFGEGDYLPGDSIFPLSTDGINLGVLICFESMFPELARGLVNKNANLLLNITNDGWFGKSLGPIEHFEFMRLRALETSRYVLRVGKTGISAIINHEGKVLKKLDLHEAGVIVDTVPLTTQKSPFVKHGYYIPLLISIMILGFTTWIERRQR